MPEWHDCWNRSVDVTLAQVVQKTLSRDKCEAMKTIIYYDASRREVSGSHTARADLLRIAAVHLLRLALVRARGWSGNESGFVHRTDVKKDIYVYVVWSVGRERERERRKVLI